MGRAREAKRKAKEARDAASKAEATRQANRKKWWNITIAIITVVGGLIGIFSAVPGLRDLFSTHEEKRLRETTKTGELKPPPVPWQLLDHPPEFHSENPGSSHPKIKGLYFKDLEKKYIYINYGGIGYITEGSKLYKGLKLFVPKPAVDSFRNATAVPLDIILAAKDDRIYVSATIRELDQGRVIGVIDFNRWVLYDDTYLCSKNDDSKLEVRDKQDKVALSLNLQPSQINILSISGYFLGDSTCLVLRSSGQGSGDTVLFIPTDGPDWKKRVGAEASKIQPMYGPLCK